MKTLEEIQTLGWLLTGYEGPAKGKMASWLANVLMEADSIEEAIRNLTDHEFQVTLSESGDFTKALRELEYNALVVRWIADWQGYYGGGEEYRYAFDQELENITED